MTRIIRITNVRAIANQVFDPAQTFIPPQITMFVTATGTTAIPIANPTQVVGAVLRGLDFAVRNCTDSGAASLTFSQCLSVGKTDPAATDHMLQGLLKFTEGLSDAVFKSR